MMCLFQALFSIVASVLHLGNVQFESGDTSDNAIVINLETVTLVSEVLLLFILFTL